MSTLEELVVDVLLLTLLGSAAVARVVQLHREWEGLGWRRNGRRDIRSRQSWAVLHIWRRAGSI